MNRFFRYFLLAGALACASSASFADTFYFNYAGAGVSASGTVIASLIASNEYLVTDMSGLRNGDAITGIMGASLSPFTINGVQWSFDNLGFATPPQVNNNGILIQLAGSPAFANLYSIGSGVYESIPLEYGQFTQTAIDLNISQTPEPGSLLLFGSGALGLAGLIRRKLSARHPLTAIAC